MQCVDFIGLGFANIATKVYRYEGIFVHRKAGRDILTHGVAFVGAGGSQSQGKALPRHLLPLCGAIKNSKRS